MQLQCVLLMPATKGLTDRGSLYRSSSIVLHWLGYQWNKQASSCCHHCQQTLCAIRWKNICLT